MIFGLFGEFLEAGKDLRSEKVTIPPIFEVEESEFHILELQNTDFVAEKADF